MTTAIQRVPKLRFPEFSGDWEEKKLGTITTKVGSGSTPRGGSAVYQNAGILFIRSQNVNHNKLLLDDVVFINQEIHENMLGSIVLPEDILLNITGASIGRSCVVPYLNNSANVNQHVCIVRIADKNSPYFVQQFISSYIGQVSIMKTQVGGGREGLNFQGVRSLKLDLPEFPEQQKIASFLSAVDSKIESLTKKKTLLEQYKKGMMQKLFSQEIRFKDNQGNEFPEWEEKRLGDIAKFSKGKGISKIDISEDGTTECIRYGELYTAYRETITKVHSKTNIPKNSLVLSENNDVIIPASGETAIDIATASCVKNAGVALGGDLNIIRSTENGVFLSYYMNSYCKNEIARLAQGVSVMHLYATQLKLLRLKLPVFSEQQKIAEFLSSIDSKIDLVAKELEKTQAFKKGLLQQMFV